MKLRLTKQQLAMAGIAALTVVTAGIGGTLAVFTDTHSIDANTFSTTSVSLIVGAPTTTNLISLANMVPGDSTAWVPLNGGMTEPGNVKMWVCARSDAGTAIPLRAQARFLRSRAQSIWFSVAFAAAPASTGPPRRSR